MKLDLMNMNASEHAKRNESRILRVNEKVSIHSISPIYKAASPSMKRDTINHVPKKKRKDLTPAPTFSRLKENSIYRTGDGEVGFVNRPNSQVAYTLPSRGIGV